MQQIINFFIRNKTHLLFILLLAVSLSLTVQSRDYHKSKVVNSANIVAGNVYSVKREITEYFSLKKHNRLLLEENIRLRNMLGMEADVNVPAATIDSAVISPEYVFKAAPVINNNYVKLNNYLTLKAGRKDGIEPGMGVITSVGIVGIVDQVSKNFSTVISILNTRSSISAKLKKSGHFGSLVWDGKDPQMVQLTDIARLVPVAVGDTITTDGRSAIFPKGIPIGTVKSFDTDPGGNYYVIDVALFNDMRGIEHVYTIKYTMAAEQKELEAATEDDQ